MASVAMAHLNQVATNRTKRPKTLLWVRIVSPCLCVTWSFSAKVIGWGMRYKDKHQLAAEWQSLLERTPLALRQAVETLVESRRDIFADHFYQVMLEDPHASLFLSNEQVKNRLHPSMQRWLSAMFAVEHADFDVRRHLHHIAVPAPGSLGEVTEVAAEEILVVPLVGKDTVIGALAVNYAKSVFTGVMPEAWLFALGALFVLGTVLLPQGIAGLLSRSRQQGSDDDSDTPTDTLDATPREATS